MPIDIINTLVVKGTDGIPGWPIIKRYGVPFVALSLLKVYCGGKLNPWERDVHGKVYILTGATAGVGSQLAEELAKGGAQLIFLVKDPSSSWTVEFVDDLRDRTGNPLVYAEQCDLADLHSVRKFATRWLDNTPPRRLDGIICCAGEALPPGAARSTSSDGVERQVAVNYLGHFHLLTLLSPSLRAQPADRDVRVVLTTCTTQAMGKVSLDDPLWLDSQYPSRRPWQVFGGAKLMLGCFAQEFQRRLDATPRGDKMPSKLRVNVVNPGFMRTASTARVLSFGSLWGLLLYLLLYPIWFTLFKTPIQGAQSYLAALFAQHFIDLPGGQFIQDCKIIKPARKELSDFTFQNKLYERTEKLIDQLERQSAKQRVRSKPKSTSKSKSSKKSDNKKVVPEKEHDVFASALKSTPPDLFPRQRADPAGNKYLDELEKKLAQQSKEHST
ncbi:BA75_01752T0 [Komagataella pastoris]|uniref:BA75_01752T0 n=1 Tax=Komagataella pastoris TaxID=4922 RepID=A0A1B2J9L9_PICPA|nr:BA75_01752T0 [Komagataella pastoris]